MPLETFLETEIYRTLLVFCRVGTAFILMPGIGETMVPMQLRLVIGLVLSLAISQNIEGAPLSVPEDMSGFIGDIMVEIFVGFWIGAIGRILLSSLHLLGHKIAYVSALANAMVGGQNVFENSSIFSNLLTMVAIVIIFVADIHHIAIEGLVRSYSLIPLSETPSMSDFADQGAKAVSEAFMMGIRFAAPFIILAIIVNAGMGLANRMMPSLPVYFVATPLLISSGIVILLMAISGILIVFSDYYANWFMTFRF